MPLLRIGLFAPYDLSRAGGVRTHIRAQATALRARGHLVTVHGPASAAVGDGEIAIGGARSLRLGGTESGLGLNPLSAGSVARALDRGYFDVVHVHEPLTPLVPWLALLLSRAPVVATFHVYRERGHRFYAAARPMLRGLMRRISRRIAVSDAARRTVAAHFPGAYDIVPNGIDVARFQQPRPRPAPFGAGFHHILYVGRIEPRKGLGHLILAMPRVHQRAPAARLMVVGDGPDRPKLEAMARAVGADAQFVGRVDDDDLPAYFQASEIVCAPAIGGESFGLVVLEAMASARPVVASRIDGFTELVGVTNCARFVPPGDDHALGDALADLMGDEAARLELGERGAARAVEFDWTHVAARLEQMYVDLVTAEADRRQSTVGR
jgi:phosphatidylinositol alpha-mannosyltransferase